MKKSLSIFIFLAGILLFFSKEGITQNIPQRLLVFDRSLSGYQTLSSTKSGDGQVLILPASGNPLEQIRIAISGKIYDEIHIYTNVKHGSAVFNSLALTSNEILAQKSLLATFKDLVSVSCRIIIHGDPGSDWLSLLTTVSGINVVSE
jgi:hypothetical protein